MALSQKVRRAWWIFMVCLFLVTSLGVGVYAFWSNTHTSKTPSYISCSQSGSVPDQKPVNGVVKGTKLADYTGPQKFSYLKCNDFKVGTGDTAIANSTVTVIYTGALATDGTVFDSSLESGQPVTFPLNQVISGWSDGLQGMKVGGTRRLFIPSQYGYGSVSVSGIPANSDLVFDVTLLAVE